MTPARTLYEQSEFKLGRPFVPWCSLTERQRTIWRIRAEHRAPTPKGAREIIRNAVYSILNTVSAPHGREGRDASLSQSAALTFVPMDETHPAQAPEAISSLHVASGATLSDNQHNGPYGRKGR